MKSAKKNKLKNKRNKEKFPNLKPELQLKTRYDLYDQDYTHKLSDKDKAWLNKFNSEWANAALDVKNLNKNFHNTQELKKDCQDRNNARNRCILTRAKATGIIDYIEDMKRKNIPEEAEDYEDAIITLIGLRNNFANSDESSGDE